MRRVQPCPNCGKRLSLILKDTRLREYGYQRWNTNTYMTMVGYYYCQPCHRFYIPAQTLKRIKPKDFA